MTKIVSKKFFIIAIINILLYDISFLFFGIDFNFKLFLYYIISLDIIFFCIISPFFSHYRIRTYHAIHKDPEPLRLLYQTKLPGAERISEDELYDIINLRTTIPEHTCSKSDYIKYLKRKGLLIVNGQHIWLYGTSSDIYQEK